MILLAKEHKLIGWLKWIIGELPDDVRPPKLFDRLCQEPGHLSRRARSRLLLPPAIVRTTWLARPSVCQRLMPFSTSPA